MPSLEEVERVRRLVGCFVVEIGARQAWPFLAFCDSGMHSDAETRLYIDTDYWLVPSPKLPDELDDTSRCLLTLAELQMLTLDEVLIDHRGLRMTFDTGIRLHVAATANATTTHDVWWLGRS